MGGARSKTDANSLENYKILTKSLAAKRKSVNLFELMWIRPAKTLRKHFFGLFEEFFLKVLQIHKLTVGRKHIRCHVLLN